jgi:nicotinamidase-related amidase
MLVLDNTALCVVDVQGKLAHLMHEKEELFLNVERLIKGAQILEMPIILTEQYPKGLGPTLSQLTELMSDVKPIEKISFSCCANDDFSEKIRELGRRQLLLTGIETHICIYQTSLDLIEAGYEVSLVADAVSSRTEFNKSIALDRIKTAGALLTTTEMALFELLHKAEGPKFKEISKLIK